MTRPEPTPGQGPVVAVVVAYDRRELLLEGLRALAAQTRRPDVVVVVDNASTDGSADAVRAWAGTSPGPVVDLVRLERNTGGAGGFAVGLARAVRRHRAGAVWLMDDDTVPTPTALQTSLEAMAATGSVLVASRVVWTDGRDHPMNTPRERPRASAAERAAAAAAGCVPVRSASFVALLLDAGAVREEGLPQAAFFLWNDDFEYTTRLLRTRRGVTCAASVVEHRTRVFGASDADPGERFAWEVRNKVWTFTRSRSLGGADTVRYGGATLLRWGRTVARSQRRGVLLRGLADGLRQGTGAPRPTAEVLAPGLPADVLADVIAVEDAAGRETGAVQRPDPAGQPPVDPAVGPAVDPAVDLAGQLPPFSVLLPVWARDDVAQLRRAVASVTAEQTLPPAELVVVRDGPVPTALQVELNVLRHDPPGGVPVVVVELPANVGLARALEEGLLRCTHDVVARMDADDVSLPHRFAAQLPLIAAGADLVGAGLLEIGADEDDVLGRRVPPVGRARIDRAARFQDPFNHPTVVYRRSAVAAAGGYRDLPLMEDYWLFARMILRGARCENLAEPLVKYRVGAQPGEGSYARRGGLALWVSELRLQRHLLGDGFTTPAQFTRNVALRGGYRFLPEGVRTAGYRWFTRYRPGPS
ncbi:glycosyltransferase [Kineococcus aurantiacus]|uniref:GT2 family glycosyltransferase n=1 Tax=Kineococcus aurantiacus TaxID=37633 RepID=A0A7Y9DMT0_9ACTN|nr:GT2 family glycosyltransferase [Kineococcus aurantiacus]